MRTSATLRNTVLIVSLSASALISSDVLAAGHVGKTLELHEAVMAAPRHRAVVAAPLGAGAGHVGSGAAGLGGSERGGYAGTSRRSGIGSADSTGWYSRGFDGTLNPGWSYGFSPNLGGLGR
jgi:hypothetical protein